MKKSFIFDVCLDYLKFYDYFLKDFHKNQYLEFIELCEKYNNNDYTIDDIFHAGEVYKSLCDAIALFKNR